MRLFSEERLVVVEGNGVGKGMIMGCKRVGCRLLGGRGGENSRDSKFPT